MGGSSTNLFHKKRLFPFQSMNIFSKLIDIRIGEDKASKIMNDYQEEVSIDEILSNEVLKADEVNERIKEDESRIITEDYLWENREIPSEYYETKPEINYNDNEAIAEDSLWETRNLPSLLYGKIL